jgi:hypothetical protein
MIYDDLWRSMMIYEDLWKNTDAMSSELARELAIAHSICFIKKPSSPTGWARLLDRTDLCSVNRVIFFDPTNSSTMPEPWKIGFQYSSTIWLFNN